MTALAIDLKVRDSVDAFELLDPIVLYVETHGGILAKYLTPESARELALRLLAAAERNEENA